MKPYQEHLKSILSFGETVSNTRKPVFRSSAIFPVVHNKTFTTELLFMGYWLRKRSIPEVTILISLRSEFGNVLIRKTLIVDQVKAYRIMLSELIQECNLENRDFIGSVELEVFSTRDMVFPYPAFVVNYISEYGSTAVHTTGRVYNDIEDMIGNAKYRVPESGFDIYSGKDNNPFFCFVNGPYDNSGKPIRYEVIDENQNREEGEIKIDSLVPYQSCFIYLKEYIDIDGFLKGNKGTIRIWLDYDGFFTRIIAGNFSKNKAVSITHSFYDSSSVTNSDAYLDNDSSELYDSYVFIPLFVHGNLYTHLVYYPIYSPSTYNTSFIFFDENGRQLKALKNWRHFETVDNAFFSIDVNAIISTEFLATEKEQIKGLMIVNDWNQKRIPTRLKYGLNIGIKNKEFNLPTNICFAPQVANPKLINKQGTFKWAPILNSKDSQVVITNCGSLRLYDRTANLSIEYYREKDGQIFTEHVQLPPYAQYRIGVENKAQLKEFLEDGTGWVAITSDNPFVNAWYFDFDNASGVVAGDHSF